MKRKYENMNLSKFTQRSIDAVSYAQQMAQVERHPQLLPEHLLLALLKTGNRQLNEGLANGTAGNDETGQKQFQDVENQK